MLFRLFIFVIGIFILDLVCLNCNACPDSSPSLIDHTSICSETNVKCEAESKNKSFDDSLRIIKSLSSDKIENPTIQVINNLDSLVFDFSQAICTPTYIQIPVYFLSDDSIYAVDIALKFNPAEFTYNSYINHKPYLMPAANYSAADSTFRFSSFSLSAMENNSPLISLRFNVSGQINLASFDSVYTLLNGDNCSVKSVNIQPAPPIVPGGITMINSGDSILLSVPLTTGFSALWSNGSVNDSTYVYNAGTFSVALTNPQGCSAISYIIITENNPLPVELISFDASKTENNIVVIWATSSEVNNDYFILQRSSDLVNWNAIARKEGSGTSSIANNYNVIDYSPINGLNYYRLRQVDYDGSEKFSGIIVEKFNNHYVEKSILQLFPNPTSVDNKFINVSLPCESENGVLSIFNIHGSELYSVKYDKSAIFGNNCIIKADILSKVSAGLYMVRWKSPTHNVSGRLVVN